MPAVDERMIPDATIVTVTKNRRDEALRAAASAVSQTAAVEVLVFAGYRTAFAARSRQESVSPALYRVFRRLGYAPKRLHQIEDVLPELPATAPRDRVGA